MAEPKATEADVHDERLRVLIEHVGDAVLMLDPQGRVLTWNPAAERLLGFTTAEALQLSVDRFYVPEQRLTGALADDLAAAAAAGRHEVTTWRLPKSGAPRWTTVVTCPIRDAAGALQGYAQIIRDTTALREAEKIIEQQAIELRRSNAELETFATVAAHDLKEPLRKIRTFSERLMAKLRGTLPPDAIALTNQIVSAGTRMESLIDGLLTYAGLSQHPRLEEADLARIVTEVKADVSLALEKAGGRVEVGALPVLRANPTQMRQLFQNLITNAVKFARPEVPPVVRIAATSDSPSTTTIEVADNGIGFEPKYAERIFGVFQRLHGRSKYEGSGIGLAICRRIVELHGGTICATAVPDAGATFNIRLPLNPTSGVS